MHPLQERARELRKSFYAPRRVSPPVLVRVEPVAEPVPVEQRLHYHEPIGPLMQQAHDLRANGVHLPPALRLAVCAMLCARRMTWQEVVSQSRIPRLVEARWDLYYRMRQFGWSLPRIADFLGRDHTTVLHGLTSHSLKNSLPLLTAVSKRRVRKELRP